MAMAKISRVAKTSANAWVAIVTAAASGQTIDVNSLTMANTAIGTARVQVRLVKASPASTTVIVPADSLPEGASGRLRLPGIVLEANDKIEVTSLGGVDWIMSGTVITP